MTRRWAMSLIIWMSLAGWVGAGEAGSVQGRVLTADGRPADDATVRVVQSGRQVPVGSDGTFRLEGLPPGTYLVEAVSPRWGRAVRSVTVKAGETSSVELVVSHLLGAAEVVVTAAPQPRTAFEAYPPTRVVAGPELDLRLQASLGETLAGEVGVHSTYFGPAASQPVIRGLGGERVLVLEDGLGTGDLYAVTPDSAVSVEPLSLERAEIVRGPTALLYGGGAIGGVVHATSEAIPSVLPTRILSGSLRLLGSSGPKERGGSADLTGRIAARWAWQAGFLKRVTGDYAVPGGRLPNSAVEAQQGRLGVAYRTDPLAVGLAVSGLRSDYGVPGTPDRIEMEKARLHFRLEARPASGLTQGLRLLGGYTDYRHREAEEVGEEEDEEEEGGTRFTNREWQARLEWLHRPVGPLTGALGMQVTQKRFQTTGPEAFLPRSVTRQWAVFLMEEVPTPRVRFQFGLRYERQTAEDLDRSVRRSFQGLSASAGALWPLFKDLYLALWATRSVRSPTVEELFADGPDPPARVFLVGRSDLTQEVSTSVDLSLRKAEGRLQVELNGFVYWFSDYVYAAPTGQVRASFPVARFMQGPARFIGGETRVALDLSRRPEARWTLIGWADAVRAELRPTGEPVPRVPPLRFGARLAYRGRSAWGSLEVFRVTAQRRVAPHETTTPGYTMVHAAVGYRFFQGRVVHDVLLRGTNLLDETARNHLSFLKDVAPLPGRSFSLMYRVTF
ncbi:putative TonB-dependent receptor [bacterium HR11]|nr:putative TonB-dependent receptor [bacterium HR11]